MSESDMGMILMTDFPVDLHLDLWTNLKVIKMRKEVKALPDVLCAIICFHVIQGHGRAWLIFANVSPRLERYHRRGNGKLSICMHCFSNSLKSTLLMQIVLPSPMPLDMACLFRWLKLW